MWMPACYRTHKAPTRSSSQKQGCSTGANFTAPAAVITISGQSLVWSMLSWTAMRMPAFWESMIRRTNKEHGVSAVTFTSEVLRCILCILEILQGVPLLSLPVEVLHFTA